MRVQLQGFQSHFGDDFQSQRIFDRFFAARTPYERPVSVDQDGRNFDRIKNFEQLDDDIPGLPFVRRSNFRRSHWPRYRYFSIKIVCVCGPQTRNAPPGLSECDGVP